jgi:hypothetical protein
LEAALYLQAVKQTNSGTAAGQQHSRLRHVCIVMMRVGHKGCACEGGDLTLLTYYPFGSMHLSRASWQASWLVAQRCHSPAMALSISLSQSHQPFK